MVGLNNLSEYERDYKLKKEMKTKKQEQSWDFNDYTENLVLGGTNREDIANRRIITDWINRFKLYEIKQAKKDERNRILGLIREKLKEPIGIKYDEDSYYAGKRDALLELKQQILVNKTE